MDWYIVVKTIKGRRYRYRQKTWREGRHVRTRSEYIGPANGWVPVPQISGEATTLELPFGPQRAVASGTLEEAEFALTDEKNSLGNWRSGWDPRPGNNFVKKDRKIDTLIKTIGVRRTSSTKGCFYNPRQDILNMPPANRFHGQENETPTEVYYSTVLHELVHSTLHSSRLGRNNGGAIRTREEYAREELVAELGAMTLMAEFGMPIKGKSMHATYFQGWLSRAGDREGALSYAREEAARAVRFILNRGIIRK